MAKIFKLFFLIGIIVVIAAGVAGLSYYRKQQAERQQKQNQKAAQVKVTIIEGWGIDDIITMLEKKNISQSTDFRSAEKNINTASYPFLASKPANADLEGFLFPDTYELYAGQSGTATSAALIQKALNDFSQKFTPAMEAQAQSREMNVYQIVTLASIIERETGRNVQSQSDQQKLDEERRTISGIFYNRLALGMPLQSDATVNYITKKNDPQATIADTQIDSPYNTYKYAGLPPGPICNPSLSSLQAAVNPVRTDYLYFLHTQPEGTVIYAKTYEEHLQNKQKYLK